MWPIAARHGIQTGGQTDFTDQPADVAWSEEQQPAALRKLTHFRQPGAGDPMWSGACVYGLSGQSPAFSQYDVPDVLSDETDDDMPYHVRAGVVTQHRLVDADEPTSTRKARVAAHYDSSPAARTFQGTFNPHWSGLMAGFRPQIRPRPLTQNFNPGQQGSKELHPATQYKPFPPMGSLVPAYGEMKAL